MNNYPIWWDTTITILNKFEDSSTNIIKWYKSVINDCFYKSTGQKVVINETILDSNSIICRIPKSTLYLPKYEWDQLSNTDKDTYFTLNSGDIIIVGTPFDSELMTENDAMSSTQSNDLILTENDSTPTGLEYINEYVQGQHATDLIAQYKQLQGCMVIEQFGINTGVGRCNEHYMVRGE